MRKVHIRGLVKVANIVRRELPHALPADRKEQLRRMVANAIQEVDRILARYGAKVDSLPVPTRRAYQFLGSVDFDSAGAQVSGEGAPPARGNVSLVGIKSFWEQVLDGLARGVAGEKANEFHDSIRSASANIDDHMESKGLAVGELTVLSRSIRGWLAFFADRANFEGYLAAVTRAKPILEAAMLETTRFRTPALIHFRALSGLYRLRGYRNGTRVMLPTPMICFSEELFISLAEAALDGGNKQPVMQATCSDEYQATRLELEALSGVEERTGGIYHDLGASFVRVNTKYFGGNLARPRLTWSRSFTGRKFGHYDLLRDTVMISCTLDRADVSTLPLDYVMYHELLHKKLGIDWRQGRGMAHTRAFRGEERRFERYAEAESRLARLAASG